jgi:hypothetical protein
MRVASKTRAIRNIFLSIAFVLTLATIAIASQDRSVVSVAIAIGVILGLPSFLLSVADLGREVKIEHGGDYRGTITAHVLSHYRAAGGAICVAAAGYTLFRNVPALVNGTSTEAMVLQLMWIGCGVLMAGLGLMLIVGAFSKESNSETNPDDT